MEYVILLNYLLEEYYLKIKSVSLEGVSLPGVPRYLPGVASIANCAER